MTLPTQLFLGATSQWAVAAFSLASSAGGSGGEAHSLGPGGGKLGSQTRLIQRRDNKPVMASGLTEPSAILESNRFPAAALKSKQSFLGFFRLMQILFCFAIENQLQAPGVRIPAGSGEP